MLSSCLFCPVLAALSAVYLQSSYSFTGTVNVLPPFFPPLSPSVISTSHSPSCSSWSDWIFLFMGHQEGSHALLLVSYKCVNVTREKPQYEAPVDETVWFIFLHHTCVSDLSVFEDMQMMHDYFFSRILLIRRLRVCEPWLFWLTGHGFGIGRRVPLVVFFSFVILYFYLNVTAR